MLALNTRQRALLQLLLQSENFIGSTELATQMGLTPRQVSYGLKGLTSWLEERDVALNVKPGVGLKLDCTPEQADCLAVELGSDADVQLILLGEQRQQLLALYLLAAKNPLILFQLQQLTQVSRTTILKDLDQLEDWFAERGLSIERRPNYGTWLEGTELAKRQALLAWVYGDARLGQPLTAITYTHGLDFVLGKDAGLLPIVNQARGIIRQWDVQRMLRQVAFAEGQLGGRFTDDAVLYLALSLAIQTARVAAKQFAEIDRNTLAWLKSSSVWATSVQIAKRLGWQQSTTWPETETAATAMAVLSAPRNERWPGDLDVDDAFRGLVDALINQIADAYALPEMLIDSTLRDGIITHVVPACLRHRFNLWMPSPPESTTLSEIYDFEHELAQALSATIREQVGVELLESELNDLKLLLRAAFIRTQPILADEIWVVCPSGMATAQLLIVRLQTRFPRLGNLKVVSVRELNQSKVASTPLIISTVSLPQDISRHTQVIKVHPMLLPEDIETITAWLSHRKLPTAPRPPGGS